MRLSVKKIVAKEFLILTLILALGLISFLCTYPYNTYKRSQVRNQATEIAEKTKVSDSLSFAYKSKLYKQNWFYEKYINQFNLRGETQSITVRKTWKRLEYLVSKDSIKYKWENVWDKELISFTKEIGFSTPIAFQDFIKRNTFNNVDLLNNQSAQKINSEVAIISKIKKENENNILSFHDQAEFGAFIIILGAIILFGLRYLFYGIKWSFKTLKQKGE